MFVELYGFFFIVYIFKKKKKESFFFRYSNFLSNVEIDL